MSPSAISDGKIAPALPPLVAKCIDRMYIIKWEIETGAKVKAIR